MELERATVKVNNIIDVITLQCNNITDINHLAYAAAVTSIEIAGLENICLVRRKKKNITKKQQWVINIEQRIMNLRSDISMLDQMNNERPSQKMIKNNNMMATKFNIISERDRQVALETNKQRLQATSNRLKRYKERQKQFHDNNELSLIHI